MAKSSNVCARTYIHCI